MVKQARDQLESNQTQEDLKAVFEGSCKLIPLKPVQKECIKLADDFVPELVEALASQMNPQVRCSKKLILYYQIRKYAQNNERSFIIEMKRIVHGFRND